MAAVAAVAGISNAELARVAFVTPQTMQGILANLERLCRDAFEMRRLSFSRWKRLSVRIIGLRRC
jgi:predicted Holliday junction resolvase-like endonuclease